MKFEVPFTILLSIVGSFTSFMFGGWGSLLSILTLIIILDFITGIIASGIEGKLSSRLGFKGIAQKVIIFALVSVAHAIDVAIGEQHMIRDATIFFYLVNETLSIIENAGRVGLPVPSFLVKAIELLKTKSNKK
ncbi:holin family protein [Bacillus salitolerans]|uniref:Holin family protein n=1 Tax=Bacillus salitolerans TaxID=1437434 RepID=A0ABW4LVS1_9BACI